MTFKFEPGVFEVGRLLEAMASCLEVAWRMKEIFKYAFEQDLEGAVTLKLEMGELTASISGLEGVLIRMGGELVEEVDDEMERLRKENRSLEKEIEFLHDMC